ncbi:hypothetical protein CHU92_14970 [Flavobacterium cyanobacteriorum]|uniref:DUF4241 domain-containing protein n=1 Tax=Flavobacterium cyanobacteriorum TaxID=2022802 RepID=A0A255YRV6_9FLAO|nr:DUF4241 domain-containing protein [Flavobacterium cyanobacteriorum]OYQ31943.1 hypothetical protein CHU92_14970 [Flavobacterium cyanobacteriorum]
MKDLKDYEIFYDLEDEINDAELVEIHIGELNLPTGRVIAADPFFTDTQQPFARTVEPDKYPVFIYMAEIDGLHHRVAYAKIKFRPEQAKKWILAITEDLTDEELNGLAEDEFYGFAVESGIAAFVDAKTNEELVAKINELQEKNPESNYYDEVLADEFRDYSGKNQFSRSLGDWNDHHPYKESDNNVIMFASGWGDGYYPAYWGLNENGDTIELVIDFLLNDFTEEEDELYTTD